VKRRMLTLGGDGGNMLKGNKTRRVKQLMLIAFVALMAVFWLGILWFAVYRRHWL